MKTVAIACRTIEDELKAVYDTLSEPFPMVWVESGLHNFPAQLKERIQQEIDQISGVENILLLFGYCGNSIEGLIAAQARLVVPKVEDCISLLLGGNQTRLAFSRETPAFYLTDGWLRYEKNIYWEYEQCLKKYGEAKSLRIFRAMFAHYSNLNFIDTGSYDLKSVMNKTAEWAGKLNLKQGIVPGTLRLITKAFKEEWDEDFLIVPPGVPLHINYEA
ncbi:DUF1638 domain-containing protein [Desulfosporosinus sp. OT]|uniref:DUF1638 domain-containing protein n=1 Tax=Desulfosporosinus sp. OT TaxID=913865 RepID=UPI000223A097|nr:DUF1638 domain-containing protein [Desulfosporosinus sp. OT]EGW36539.1 hypothetical protein DOT_5554 [Desulfosporosinus sp. OT]